MKKDVREKFPPEGLILSSDLPNGKLMGSEKAALNRRGNQLFNVGEIEKARRIFQTTGYSDGLIRVGDAYMSQNLLVEALKMYWLAHDDKKSSQLIYKAAIAIRCFLKSNEAEHE